MQNEKKSGTIHRGGGTDKKWNGPISALICQVLCSISFVLFEPRVPKNPYYGLEKNQDIR